MRDSSKNNRYDYTLDSFIAFYGSCNRKTIQNTADLGLMSIIGCSSGVVAPTVRFTRISGPGQAGCHMGGLVTSLGGTGTASSRTGCKKERSKRE
ncbi:hypothetical protein evm_012345 [Chilo suppressalis]|nr:hypothetical protein evm_012345 [Chilo suppressalis]